MRLILHPDPGTGRHWRLTLEIGDLELSCDVAGKDDPGIAVAVAAGVARELDLRPDGPDAWSKT